MRASLSSSSPMRRARLCVPISETSPCTRGSARPLPSAAAGKRREPGRVEASEAAKDPDAERRAAPARNEPELVEDGVARPPSAEEEGAPSLGG